MYKVSGFGSQIRSLSKRDTGTGTRIASAKKKVGNLGNFGLNFRTERRLIRN